MQRVLISNAIATVIFVAFAIYATRNVWLRKQEMPRERYEIRPFVVKGDLFTFAEFQNLLKIYSCGSDNGTGFWASADGNWFDRDLNEIVRVCPENVRLGKRPEPFFTHIMYFGK